MQEIKQETSIIGPHLSKLADSTLMVPYRGAYNSATRFGYLVRSCAAERDPLRRKPRPVRIEVMVHLSDYFSIIFIIPTSGILIVPDISM